MNVPWNVAAFTFVPTVWTAVLTGPAVCARQSVAHQAKTSSSSCEMVSAGRKFLGADESPMKADNYAKEIERLKKKLAGSTREMAQSPHALLLATIVQRGQLFGNRTKGSNADTTITHGCDRTTSSKLSHTIELMNRERAETF